jgi:hypothetical protein
VVTASSESREKAGETARSTATSTLAIDDLLDDLELPGGCFFSARRQRAPADARGVERGQMRGRGEFQRGGCQLLTVGVSMVYGAPRRKPLAVAGGALGRHCALSAGVCSVLLVAAWLGRNTSRYSWDTVVFRLGPVATVHHDARWGWQRAAREVPCTGV